MLGLAEGNGLCVFVYVHDGLGDEVGVMYGDCEIIGCEGWEVGHLVSLLGGLCSHR